ncbi:MAG TPA: ATP-binding protein [Allosphingosinicella sp.]|nr:ATP-binding protein [Allosphingosinicella sp.]
MDEAHLSAIAKSSEKSLPDTPIQAGPRLKILPAVAIYGSNASGKTNLLKALAYMKEAVGASHARWKPDSSTQIDPHTANRKGTSLFEVEIMLDEVRYRYGFCGTITHFCEEWLYSYPKGRERILFHRRSRGDAVSHDDSFEFGSFLKGGKRDNSSTARRTRQNSLFVSAGAQDNQEDCLRIYNWFTERVFQQTDPATQGLEVQFTARLARDFPKFKRLLLPTLRLADESISDVELLTEDGPSDDTSRDDAERFFRENLRIRTEFLVNIVGEVERLPFDRESRGTKKLYAVAGELITALLVGGVLVIDELEASMHPHLASRIVAIFQNKASNPNGAQLVFSTHESRLLNLKHLRRDQVWFVEKEDGKSSVYSLLEFSPRKDENFEAGYLRGRYGALPSLGISPEWIELINTTTLKPSDRAGA